MPAKKKTTKKKEHRMTSGEFAGLKPASIDINGIQSGFSSLYGKVERITGRPGGKKFLKVGGKWIRYSKTQRESANAILRELESLGKRASKLAAGLTVKK